MFMRTNPLREFMCALVPAVICALPAAADAQTYPVKPIRIVVPYAPGGSVDAVARWVAPELSKRLGHTVVIDNVAGAGGVIGTERAARAAASRSRSLPSKTRPCDCVPTVLTRIRAASTVLCRCGIQSSAQPYRLRAYALVNFALRRSTGTERNEQRSHAIGGCSGWTRQRPRSKRGPQTSPQECTIGSPASVLRKLASEIRNAARSIGLGKLCNNSMPSERANWRAARGEVALLSR